MGLAEVIGNDMARIAIHIQSLQASKESANQSIALLKRSQQSLKAIKNYPFTMTQGLYQNVDSLMQECRSLQEHLLRVSSFVKESQEVYENLEKRIQRKATIITKNNRKNTNGIGLSSSLIHTLSGNHRAWKSVSNSAGTYQTIGTSSKESKWKGSSFDVSKSKYNGFTFNRGIGDILSNGMKAGASASYYVGNANYADNPGDFRNRAEFSVGIAEVSGKIHASFRNKGKISPKLEAEVGASVSAAKGMVSSAWIHEYGDVKVQGKGDIGVVSAKASAVIKPKEVTIEGEVGAAALRGEASAKFSLFGVTLTTTVSGEVGGVGASGKFSSKENSIEIGGRLSFLFGAGLNIKIEY